MSRKPRKKKPKPAPKPRPCPFCEYVEPVKARYESTMLFSQSERLASHVLRRHLPVESFHHRCWCGRLFGPTYAYSFNKHISENGGYKHHAMLASIAGEQ